MSGITPTQLTLRDLKRRGLQVSVTEHWNPFARKRHDLWGWCDVLALGDGYTLGVQCTTKSNISSRWRKTLGLCEGALAAGWRVEVWGWYKDRGRWKVEVLKVTPDDLQDYYAGAAIGTDETDEIEEGND